MNSEIYTLTLIFDESFTDDEGVDINVPVFIPYSYSSEESAIMNAEIAEEVYGESLMSWGITKVDLDMEITPKYAGEVVH